MNYNFTKLIFTIYALLLVVLYYCEYHAFKQAFSQIDTMIYVPLFCCFPTFRITIVLKPRRIWNDRDMHFFTKAIHISQFAVMIFITLKVAFSSETDIYNTFLMIVAVILIELFLSYLEKMIDKSKNS